MIKTLKHIFHFLFSLSAVSLIGIGISALSFPLLGILASGFMILGSRPSEWGLD